MALSIGDQQTWKQIFPDESVVTTGYTTWRHNWIYHMPEESGVATGYTRDHGIPCTCASTTTYKSEKSRPL
jgi:hypothetical protein